MDISVLEDLGLTAAQIKVYLALLELGATKAGPVVRVTHLQNSAVHLALGQLADKGLVSFVKKGRVKYYSPSDPRAILRFIDEKRIRAESLIDELLKKQKHKERQEAEVFLGFQGFKAMCYQFIEDALAGEDYLFFAFITKSQKYDAEVNRFYGEFTHDRLRRGLNLKGIAHVDARPYFIQNKRDLSNILFVDFPVLKNASVCGNKVIFTPWEDAQIAFMITSRQLAENLREHFYSIWNQFKKTP